MIHRSKKTNTQLGYIPPPAAVGDIMVHFNHLFNCRMQNPGHNQNVESDESHNWKICTV